jgi:hypothetical protein
MPRYKLKELRDQILEMFPMGMENTPAQKIFEIVSTVMASREYILRNWIIDELEDIKSNGGKK